MILEYHRTPESVTVRSADAMCKVTLSPADLKNLGIHSETARIAWACPAGTPATAVAAFTGLPLETVSPAEPALAVVPDNGVELEPGDKVLIKDSGIDELPDGEYVVKDNPNVDEGEVG